MAWGMASHDLIYWVRDGRYCKSAPHCKVDICHAKSVIIINRCCPYPCLTPSIEFLPAPSSRHCYIPRAHIKQRAILLVRGQTQTPAPPASTPSSNPDPLIPPPAHPVLPLHGRRVLAPLLALLVQLLLRCRPGLGVRLCCLADASRLVGRDVLGRYLEGRCRATEHPCLPFVLRGCCIRWKTKGGLIEDVALRVDVGSARW